MNNAQAVMFGIFFGLLAVIVFAVGITPFIDLSIVVEYIIMFIIASVATIFGTGLIKTLGKNARPQQQAPPVAQTPQQVQPPQPPQAQAQ